MRYATLLATWTLVHFAWQGLLLGAAYLAWRRLGRAAAPERRYRASLTFLLALAAAVPATALALHRALVRDAAVAIAGPELFAQPRAAPVMVAGALPLAGAAPAWVAAGARWLPALWALGCLVALARLAGAWRRERRLARCAHTGSPALRRRVAELGARLGVLVPVRVVVPRRGASPYVTGGRRATLVLPAPVLRALPPDEADAVLLHELAHVRRGDHAANLLQHLVESALWFHPAVWLVSRAAREERERCCDRLAVRAGGDGRALARALARLAVQEPPRLRHAALAFASGRGGIVGRVRELARESAAASPPEGVRRQRLLEAGGVLAAALLLAAAVRAPAPERTLWEAGSLAAAIPTRTTTVDGVDPAGRFRLHFVNGVAAAAELDGRRYERARLERRGDVLRVRGTGGATLLAVTLDGNGISWEPRARR